MLTNTELIVLSLINEKPSYPYELEKQIKHRIMRYWMRIGIASIYQVLERLKHKNFVEFETERTGKAPERKRYYLTEQGRQELKSSVKDLLGKMEWYYLDLNVAIEGSDILEPEEIAEALRHRLEAVRVSKEKIRQVYTTTDNRTFKAMTVLRNVIALRETEEKLLLKAIEELLNGKDN